MAKDNLPACLPVILAYEGGLSMIRSDPGNWTGGRVGVGVLKGTNMGIAASSHPSLDIARLTKTDVEAIYAKEYWTPAECETLPAGLDLSHFDGTVNSGLERSVTWLKTAMTASKPVDRVHGYATARLTSLHAFSTWATFGKGWAARVAGVEAKSVAMVAGAAAPAIIAAASAKAATKAKVMSAVAHGSAITTGAAAVTATAHPCAGTTVGTLAILSTLWAAFHASTSGARAATLANATAQA